ncbi:slipin family protein [bacterium]|nr:MAG: slipin family protein [candidate division KSB1 bacterium]MCE7940840.1 slipin family protein [Chlorobi bacterium CHB1]MCL4708042.1 slipin family protein [bacterium]MDL1876628.1 slipin family protein [Cytophagia bacterium CHB2]MBC6947264.1 slipin family protein [candidate division KSB1 bacterium]
MMGLPIWMIFLIVFGIMILAMAIQVVREYERLVVFRLGKHVGARGPGLVLIIPFVERFVKVSTRLIAMDVPPQDVITRDNVSIKVNAVLYFRVIDPNRAVLDVEDFLFATSQIAQTTLRSVLGQAELDELLAQRERINDKLQNIIDTHTDPWGIKVGLVEVKHVDLPPEMQRAMARQAEAERERRAKVIHAEGELQASEKLAEAARVMSQDPISVQLRYLQTLTEIASEHNSTTIFPLPIDLIKIFLDSKDQKKV